MFRRCEVVLLVAGALLVCTGLRAQQKGNVMKNETVVSMVKSGMPESLIVGAIQSSESQFDVSAGALAELKKAGVSPKVIDAMVAAEAGKNVAVLSASSKTSALGTPGGVSPASSSSLQQQPYVLLVQEKTKQNIAVEKAQITPAKTKNQDLNSLAYDSALAQALQNLAGQAAVYAAAKSNSSAAVPFAETARSIVGSFTKRQPSVTYVWALAGRNSSTAALATNTPKFEAVYDAVAGVNAKEYAPVLLKLVPAQNNWRLVGAAKGQVDALQSTTADWEIYSSLVEERIPIKLNPLPQGQVQLEPASPLEPGEYGVVLRPIMKNKRVSGSALLSQQGEALLLNLVWSFVVASGSRAQ